MKVELDIINTIAEWLIAVTLCAASILALSRKQLDNPKYDDALENLTLLCLIFTLIGLWARVIVATVQAMIVDWVARDPSMHHTVPFLIAFLVATILFALAYHFIPRIPQIDSEAVKPWIFIAQSSMGIFFTVGIAATLIVRACIRGGL